MKRLSRVLAILFMVMFIVGCTQNEKESTKRESVELTISAAATLKSALTEVKALYEEKNDGIKLTLNFGSSGSLQSQIEQGANVDLFISAGESQIKALDEKDLILKNTKTSFIGNKLVVITLKGNSNITSLESLKSDEIKNIGMGEMGSVPAAKTSKEILEIKEAGLWDKLQDKFVYAKDLNQILAYVEAGNADAGFVWDTIAINSDKVKVAFVPDENKIIGMPTAVISASKHQEEAKEFLEFLKSDDSIEIFKKYGFSKME